MSGHLIRVTTRTACFGLVEQNGQLVDGAPYGMAALKRANITRARAAVQHFRRQGAKVEWWPVAPGKD